MTKTNVVFSTFARIRLNVEVVNEPKVFDCPKVIDYGLLFCNTFDKKPILMGYSYIAY